MRISIIIPCYNGASFVQECLTSLKIQDYGDFEVVFVDDCSTDESYETAAKTVERLSLQGLIVRKEINEGESKAVNTGLDNCTGEVAVVLSVDDKLAPGALTAVSETLSKNPDAVGCFGNWVVFGKGEETEIDLRKKAVVARMIEDFDCLPSVGSAFRTTFAGEKLLRNPEWGPVADFEFWLRCASVGPLLFVPRTLGYWRDNETSQSNTAQCRIAQKKVELAEQFASSLIAGTRGGKKMLVAANLQALYLALQGSCSHWRVFLNNAITTSVPRSISYLLRTLLFVPILKGLLKHAR
jgi:glycosyltransferase involved in cell wall biosynthesis